MSEHVPKPSREERERAIEAYEEADPTTYSTLNPKGEMREIGTAKSLGEDKYRENKVFDHENDVYYKIEHGALQQIVSRLVKGIVNVTDIVEREGENGLEFYSRKMPLERVAEETTDAEMWADIEFMRMIFSDWDHDPEGGPPEPYPRNIRSEYGRTNLYDFNATEFSDDYKDLRRDHDIQTYGILKNKLEAFQERAFTGEGKQFVQHLYTEATNKEPGSIKGLDSSEVDFEEFYRILHMRTLLALFSVKTGIESLSDKKAA